MVNFYRENGVLFVESRMELRFPIVVNGVSHQKKEHESFEDVDLVYALLERNGRVLIKDEEKFKRFSLGEFADIISLKKYNLVEGLPSITTEKDVKKEEAILECFPQDRDYQRVREQKASEITDDELIMTPPKIIQDEPVAVNEPAPVQKQHEQQNYNKKRNKERQYNNNNEQKQPQNNNVNAQKGDAK